MNDNTIKFVRNLRIGFYVALFAALLLRAIILMPPLHAEGDERPTYELFWPPDMVPHPMPPHPEPKQPNDPALG